MIEVRMMGWEGNVWSRKWKSCNMMSNVRFERNYYAPKVRMISIDGW
jgi:hypothetical protein